MELSHASLPCCPWLYMCLSSQKSLLIIQGSSASMLPLKWILSLLYIPSELTQVLLSASSYQVQNHEPKSCTQHDRKRCGPKRKVLEASLNQYLITPSKMENESPQFPLFQADIFPLNTHMSCIRSACCAGIFYFNSFPSFLSDKPLSCLGRLCLNRVQPRVTSQGTKAHYNVPCCSHTGLLVSSAESCRLWRITERLLCTGAVPKLRD